MTQHCEVCGSAEIHEHLNLRLYRVIEESDSSLNRSTIVCGGCLLGGLTEICEPVTILSVEEEADLRIRRDVQ